MNKILEKYARQQLKQCLGWLPEVKYQLFKRMYSSKGILTKPIDEVVDEMPANKLDGVLSQVERTLLKAKEYEDENSRPNCTYEDGIKIDARNKKR